MAIKNVEIFNEESIKESLNKNRVLIKNNLNNIQNFYLDSNTDKIGTLTQSFFSTKPFEKLQGRTYELILSHASLSEKSGPGSFVEFMNLISEGLKFSDYRDFISLLKIRTEDDLKKVEYIQFKHVEKLIESLSLNSKISEILKSAIELAGFKGRISIESSNSNVCTVELVRGYTFSTNLMFSSNKMNYLLKDPRVLSIDGFIENVSEVNKLLECNHQAKEPLLIFARKFDNNVINTLRVNLDSGKLQVIPLVVQFETEGLNTLNDIAIVTGGDVVSSLKGQLISSVNYFEIPRIERAQINPTSVVLTNNSTSNSVSVHTQNLLVLREAKSEIEDICDLYDKRIKSLSPNHVILRISSSIDEVILKQSLDVILRSVKSGMEHGVIYDEKLGYHVPLTKKISAYTLCGKCLTMLNELGSVVTT